MSFKTIRKLVEQRVLQISPAVMTSFEGVEFEPVEAVPYIRVQLVYGKPDDTTLGCAYYRENPTLQLFVLAPKATGTAEAVGIAEQLRTLFSKGSSFAELDTSIRVLQTPYIGSCFTVQDRLVVPVFISLFVEVAG